MAIFDRSPKPKPKITTKKLAAELQRIVYPERPSELIQATHAFKAASKVIGEERLLDEIACLMFFAVDAGVMAALAGRSENELVRKAFLERLKKRIGATFFEMFIMRSTGYSKAIKDAPDDLGCVGRRFTEFCGLENNAAVALVGTPLFFSISKQAQELIPKYRIST